MPPQTREELNLFIAQARERGFSDEDIRAFIDERGWAVPRSEQPQHSTPVIPPESEDLTEPSESALRAAASAIKGGAKKALAGVPETVQFLATAKGTPFAGLGQAIDVGAAFAGADKRPTQAVSEVAETIRGGGERDIQRAQEGRGAVGKGALRGLALATEFADIVAAGGVGIARKLGAKAAREVAQAAIRRPATALPAPRSTEPVASLASEARHVAAQEQAFPFAPIERATKVSPELLTAGREEARLASAFPQLPAQSLRLPEQAAENLLRAVPEAKAGKVILESSGIAKGATPSTGYKQLGPPLPRPQPAKTDADLLAKRGRLGALGAWTRAAFSHAFSPEGAFPMVARHFRDKDAQRFFTRDLPRMLDELKGRKKVLQETAGVLHREMAYQVSRYATQSGKSVQEIGRMADKARRTGRLDTLPEGPLREAAREAGQFVDDLSEEFIARGMLSEKNVEVFKKNLGRYFHIRHAKFDVADWAKHVEGTAIWERMERFMLDRFPEMAPDQRLAKMYEIADADPRALSFIAAPGRTSQKLTELKRRKDIPEVVREFMGFQQDFLKSFDDSSLLMIHDLETTTFWRQIMERGLETGAFRAQQSGPFFKGRRLSKLDPEVYMTDEVAALFDGLEQASEAGNWFLRLAGMTKFGKVVFSPQTQIRNFESGLLMATRGGYLHTPAFWKALGKSFAAHKATLGGAAADIAEAFTPTSLNQLQPVHKVLQGWRTNSKAAQSLFEEGLRHNVLKQGANAGEMMDYLKQTRGELGLARAPLESGASRTAMKRLIANKPYRTAADALSALRDAFVASYHAGDDIWKLATYQVRKNELRWALGLRKGENVLNSSDAAAFVRHFGVADLEVASADTIKATMQHYDNAPRLAKWLGRNPITSPFVTFQFEMPRNTINVLRYATREFKMAKETGNQRWAWLGISKVAGVAEALWGVHLATSYFNEKFGISDAMMAAARRTLFRDYNANSENVVTNVGDGKITYLDSGYSDPNGQIKRVLIAGLARGGDLADKMAWVAEELDDIYLGNELLFSSAVEQIINRKITGGIGEALLAGTGIIEPEEAIGGRIVNPEDPLPRQAKDRAHRFFRGVAPGALVTGERLARALNLMDNSDFNYELFNELVALGGPRFITVDIAKESSSRLRRLDDQRTDITRAFERPLEIGESLQNRREFVEGQWEVLWEQAQTIVEDARTWGKNRKQLIQIVRDAGFRQDMAEDIVDGRRRSFRHYRDPRRRPPAEGVRGGLQ